MNTSRTGKNIIALLFFSLVTICPQLGYGNILTTETVKSSAALWGDDYNDGSYGIVREAAVISNLGNGKYKAILLLKNKEQAAVELKKEDIDFKLMGYSYERNNVKIEHVEYSKQCPSNNGPSMSTLRGCVVIITGTVEGEEPAGGYKGYIIKVPYRNNANSEDGSKVFHGDIRNDLEISEGLGVMSSKSGIFKIKLKNISGDNIKIKQMYLKSKLISLLGKTSDIDLSSSSTHEIEFKISNDNAFIEGDGVGEFIVIDYTKNGLLDRSVWVPIEITHESFTKNPWFIGAAVAVCTVVTTSIIVGGSVIIKLAHLRNLRVPNVQK